MEFRTYQKDDYDKLIDFLIKLSEGGNNHINWNWARVEWMMEHPETDKSKIETIGLWWDKDRVVGAAIYDMYFGEAFCGALSEYGDILTDIYEYAYSTFKDDGGLGVAICNDDSKTIELVTELGYKKVDQTENILKLDLTQNISTKRPENIVFKDYDPAENPYEFAWLLWQGFDHGDDKLEFENQDKKELQSRKHLDKRLSLAAIDSSGKAVGYVCLWYLSETDYAYVEPVCTIPEYRNQGIAKALLFEAFGRVKNLGAKKAIVISDMDFYKRMGFVKDALFTFYWK